jgi:hypothetical protein
MENLDQFYRWMKVKNGRLYMAVVDLDIVKNEIGNEILENYSGYGYSDHSVDVGQEGWERWKEGLREGLQFALLHSSDFWTIKINGLSGKPFMDTNAAIIGYTGILAFIKQTNVVIDNLQEIENFVFTSWNNGIEDKIPDFKELIFH